MASKQRTNAERRRKANATKARNLAKKIGKGNIKGFNKETTFETEADYFKAKHEQSLEANCECCADNRSSRIGRATRKKTDKWADGTRIKSTNKVTFVVPSGYDRVPRKMKKALKAA